MKFVGLFLGADIFGPQFYEFLTQIFLISFF